MGFGGQASLRQVLLKLNQRCTFRTVFRALLSHSSQFGCIWLHHCLHMFALFQHATEIFLLNLWQLPDKELVGKTRGDCHLLGGRRVAALGLPQETHAVTDKVQLQHWHSVNASQILSTSASTYLQRRRVLVLTR